jgi:hypothetical protein
MSFRIEKLRKEREVGKFDCGASDQNRYLRELAWQNMQLGYGVTYVAVEESSGEESSGDVAGFYSLAAGHVEFENMQDSPDHLFLSMEVGRSLIEAAR